MTPFEVGAFGYGGGVDTRQFHQADVNAVARSRSLLRALLLRVWCAWSATSGLDVAASGRAQSGLSVRRGNAAGQRRASWSRTVIAEWEFVTFPRRSSLHFKLLSSPEAAINSFCIDRVEDFLQHHARNA